MITNGKVLLPHAKPLKPSNSTSCALVRLPDHGQQLVGLQEVLGAVQSEVKRAASRVIELIEVGHLARGVLGGVGPQKVAEAPGLGHLHEPVDAIDVHHLPLAGAKLHPKCRARGRRARPRTCR